MAITPAQDLKPGDIIRTHSRGDALAVIYKVVRAVGGDKTVEQLEVFTLVTADNAPSRSRPISLTPETVKVHEGKLPTPDPVVAVQVPPYPLKISADQYFADRVGSVSDDILSAMEKGFTELDGPNIPYGEPDDVRVPGTQYDRIFGASINEMRLEPKVRSSGSQRPYRRRKPKSGKLGIHGPASVTTTADIPIYFAVSAMGLDPRIARFLEVNDIKTLYQARTLTRDPEKLSKLFKRHANIFSVDQHSPSTEISEDQFYNLFDNFRQDGEPESLTLQRLMDALEAQKPAAIQREIESVWSKFMEEYLQFPTHGDVPDKYKQNGQSVLIRTPC